MCGRVVACEAQGRHSLRCAVASSSRRGGAPWLFVEAASNQMMSLLATLACICWSFKLLVAWLCS